MSRGAAKALSDARLMLESFNASAWRELEVVCGAMRLSMSRLTAVERATQAAGPRPASATFGARVGETVLTAPHVATLQELATSGSTLRAGEIYATLSLLDEPIELVATQTMHVVSSLSRQGEFVEFNSPLLTVEFVPV